VNSDFVESPDQSLLYAAYYHYSLFHLLNHVITSKATNLRILDLACGNAIIGRKIKQLNPSISIVGVDQSEAMLNEAHRLNTQQGITDNFSLFKCDVKYLPEDLGLFHCIVSGFFLAHASTRRDLFVYFQQISEHLLPGGLTVHVIPVVDQLIPEGKAEKIRLEMHQQDGVSSFLEIFNYHWLERTYRNAASTSGLVEISCQPAAICPRGYV
jgi:SAM-dependent methyltransferase